MLHAFLLSPSSPHLSPLLQFCLGAINAVASPFVLLEISLDVAMFLTCSHASSSSSSSSSSSGAGGGAGGHHLHPVGGVVVGGGGGGGGGGVLVGNPAAAVVGVVGVVGGVLNHPAAASAAQFAQQANIYQAQFRTPILTQVRLPNIIVLWHDILCFAFSSSC